MNEILRRDDVKRIIEEIKNNDKYFNKISIDSDKYYAEDMALYVFYEALLKYYLIFDSFNYLDEYIYDLDLLYRKIDSIEDIKFGITKLIIKFTMKCLDLEEEKREEIIKYVYSKYITNGYLIHGFSSIYGDNILENGFKPNEYYNYYEDFIKLNDIFKKYNKDNFIDKDFIEKKVFFSDDIIKSCIYSINSPMYFCNLLTNNDIIKDKQKDYYKDNYDNCMKNVNKIINDLGFSKDDSIFFKYLVNKEWELLHKNNKKISLLLVRRDLFDLESINLEDIINSDLDINEAIDRVLTIKYNNIPCDREIDINDLRVINFELFNREAFKEEIEEEKKEIEKEKEQVIEKKIKEDFNDTYGMVSPLLLLGSLLISLGVIISIIHLLG